MKMSKTILPALAMLLVSAVMLSTASFAWFAISSQATAENMQVGVKSDSAFLVIADDAAKIQGSYLETKHTFNDAILDIAPAALDVTKLPAVVADTAYTSSVEAEIAKNTGVWYKMDGKEINSSEGTNLQNIAAANLGNYVRKYTVWVAVAPQTDYTMTNVTASVEINGDPSVSVLVVGPDNYAHFSNGNSGNDTTLPVVNPASATGIIDASINRSAVQVDIYIYYNGNHSNITTENLFKGTINDTTVTVKFTATGS